MRQDRKRGSPRRPSGEDARLSIGDPTTSAPRDRRPFPRLFRRRRPLPRLFRRPGPPCGRLGSWRGRTWGEEFPRRDGAVETWRTARSSGGDRLLRSTRSSRWKATFKQGNDDKARVYGPHR
ncbi:hypothetical protein BHE74_00027309 [Ensete ventricosum]|nr:hypothetical protein BHE74_00027309 [Ensete ventricosum]